MFFFLFLKRGLKHKVMDSDEKRKYVMWGKLRVQDASNDMVVEVRSSEPCACASEPCTCASELCTCASEHAWSNSNPANLST